MRKKPVKGHVSIDDFLDFAELTAKSSAEDTSRLRQSADHLRKAVRAVRQANKIIAERDLEIAARDREIANLNSLIVRQASTIDTMGRELSRRN